jgi:hypothetical protein
VALGPRAEDPPLPLVSVAAANAVNQFGTVGDRAYGLSIDAMFTPYGSAFDADALKVLQEAFDQAWAEVIAVSGVSLDEQSTRDRIALRIVKAWRDEGERDLDRLKAYALDGFNSSPANRPM